MISCTPENLVQQAGCLQCLSEKQLLQISAYLLCQILNNGGGGGGGGANPSVIYTNDPNAEGLKPANPALPATAYSSNGQGAIFGWSVTGQNWV